MKLIYPSDMDIILNQVNNVILSENIFGDTFNFIKDFLKQNMKNYKMIKQANETIKDIDFYSEVGINKDTLIVLTKQNVIRSMDTCVINGKKVKGNNLNLNENNIDTAINYYLEHKNESLLNNIYNMVKILKNKNVVESNKFTDWFKWNPEYSSDKKDVFLSFLIRYLINLAIVLLIIMIICFSITLSTGANSIRLNKEKTIPIEFYYDPNVENDSNKEDNDSHFGNYMCVVMSLILIIGSSHRD